MIAPEVQQAAEEAAAKDRALLAKLQGKVARMVSVGRPNRAAKRMALRHANRTWTGPMTARAKRERRALARAGIFIHAHPVDD